MEYARTPSFSCNPTKYINGGMHRLLVIDRTELVALADDRSITNTMGWLSGLRVEAVQVFESWYL